ncbi:CAP domain containing protein [Trichuris trichiura]|uniref:CAP domain containing protein n=1 Tax=Trichuris trichiura TaxID=36087 RepID=A0A077Z8Z8_TRITR|nr:CAP domain containing protein [Trichuris trichiura]
MPVNALAFILTFKTSWDPELEAEAQKISDNCLIVEKNDKYGIGMVYTPDPVASTSKYVDLVNDAASAVSGDCTCAAGKQEQCDMYKQFTYWEGGKIGCAVSECSAPPNVRTKVMTCLFEKRFHGAKCSYAKGTACNFCSAGLNCVDGLCCKSVEPSKDGSCGLKPEQLVPLYKLYDRSQKYTALTTLNMVKEQLKLLGYFDNGTIGYISPIEQSSCGKLKPLIELGSPSKKELLVYVADKLHMLQLAKSGYLYRGTIGYVVEEEGFCSSTLSVYNFGLYEASNFYLSNEEEAEKLVGRRDNLAPAYKGKPFAIWKEE